MAGLLTKLRAGLESGGAANPANRANPDREISRTSRISSALTGEGANSPPEISRASRISSTLVSPCRIEHDHDAVLDFHDVRRAVLQFDARLSPELAKDEAWALTQARFALPDEYRPRLQPAA